MVGRGFIRLVIATKQQQFFAKSSCARLDSKGRVITLQAGWDGEWG
jgi:hypothetical protein